MSPTPIRVDDRHAAVERNLRLYPVHRALAASYPWLPVLELYTTSRFGLSAAITLIAVYYLSVTILEVPTGWLSDRMGRVPTLRLAALSWMAAQVCYLAGDGRLVVVALGQVCMAAGFAALSGTDVSFHADNLEAAGRLGELAAREARITATARIAYAAAVLAGGALALLDLRAAFVASLSVAAIQAAVALRFAETGPPPPAEASAPTPRMSPVDVASPGAVSARAVPARAVPDRGHLLTCLGYFRQRLLAWILVYAVALVTLEHLASTLLQPWLVEALGRDLEELGPIPLVSAALLAATAPVGAAAARWSVTLRRRLGLVVTLLGLAVVSAVVVTGMAWWVSTGALVLFALRGVQPAAARVLIESEVVVRVAAAHRATLLSLQSLAGRLGYGLLLLVTAAGAERGVAATYSTMAAIAWTLVAGTALAAALLIRPRQPEPVPR